VIQLNDELYWLYAAVDPETNKLLRTELRYENMEIKMLLYVYSER
jgi:hypothetical protein